MWKLIIVDDEIKTREILHAIIPWDSLGVSVEGVASDGEEGIALARKTNPDIIITDVRMPRKDGIAFAKEIRMMLPLCQIIFISGYSDKEYLKSAITLKAVSYVEKPLDMDEVEAAVREATAALQIERENQGMTEGKLALELIAPTWNPGFATKLSLSHPEFASAPGYRTAICQFQYAPSSNGLETKDKAAYNEIHSALLAERIPFLLAHKQPRLFIVHLGDRPLPDNGEEQDLLVFFERLRQAVASFAQVFIAAGSCVKQLSDIRSSYIDSAVGLQELFYTGYNHLHDYRPTDLNTKSANLDVSFLVSGFSQALRHDNRQESVDIVRKLSHRLCSSKPRVETNINVKNIYYQLLLAFSSLCNERGIARVFADRADFIWEAVATIETISELTDYLLDKLDIYFAEVADMEANRSLVHTIQQYIEVHYAVQDLSIIRIAQALHFTPSYLSQVFKRKTGMTINTYITNYRMEKAKSLLKQKNRKLVEIALQVGYSDANYFTRLFRKHIGVTPSEFREKFLL